jgi:hypothetical protein
VTGDYGRNSGAGALLLSKEWGAERIIMLGYDCRYSQDGTRHWHGDHPKGLGNCQSVGKFPSQFAHMAPRMEGVEVINASRDTALDMFPRQSLEEALGVKRKRKAKVTRVCVLKTGKEYRPEHVQWLARQVPGLVCVTEDDVHGVPTVKPTGEWPGWWSKMNIFDPALIPGDLMYFDLDTVVRCDPAELEQIGTTAMLSDFKRLDLPASGLMYISQGDKAKVWEEWNRDPVGHMARCTTREKWGDQGFLAEVLKPVRWQDVMPGAVRSYNFDVKRAGLQGCKVVCFHGQPRPWDSGEDWVPAL